MKVADLARRLRDIEAELLESRQERLQLRRDLLSLQLRNVDVIRTSAGKALPTRDVLQKLPSASAEQLTELEVLIKNAGAS